MTSTMLSATTIAGTNVVNPEGENLGEVEDLMIDLQGPGSIQYAVLSFGGFLGMGEKLFAVPFQQLQADQTNECFVLNVDKERLKDAPGFDKNDWPNFADPSFRDSINSYYATS